MLEIEDFTALAERFKILGDGSRLRIFWILCHSKECVSSLSIRMQMSPPAVSHHLKQLRLARLLTQHREGKEVYYHAADSTEVHQLHHAIEALMHISCEACE